MTTRGNGESERRKAKAKSEKQRRKAKSKGEKRKAKSEKRKAKAPIGRLAVPGKKNSEPLPFGDSSA
jgi:hypothetical protein